MHRPAVGTIYLLKRAELAVRSCMDVALAEFDLTPAQFLVMFRLKESEEISAAALARAIGVRPQSIIGLLSPLMLKGLLEREPSPAHRRVLHIRLTSAGKRVVGEATRAAARIEAELLAGVDEKRLAKRQEMLALLWERAERHALHPGSIRERAHELMRAQFAPGRRRGARTLVRRARSAAAVR